MPCALRTGVLATLVLAASGNPVAAQAERRPTFARVLGPDGAPVAGAEVTFAGGAASLGPEILPTDVQVVASDERGRARARLLPDLCYVAWAVRSPADRLPLMLSPAVGYFGAGALLELPCDPGAMRTFDPVGSSAWSDVGPLRWFLMTPRPGAELELAPDAEGRLRWPPIHDAVLEARTAAGEPLWHATDGGDVTLPPPKRIEVRVVDEHGAPLAGARLRHRVGVIPAVRTDVVPGHSRMRLRVVATTDAEGRAVVEVPCAGDPLRDPGGWMMLYVDAPGRALVAGGSNGQHVYVDDRRVEGFTGDTLEFTLPAVQPLRVAPGILPPGTNAQLLAVCKLRNGGTGYMHDPRTFTAVAGADGALEFDHVPDDVRSLHLALRLPDGRRCTFESIEGRNLPPELKLPCDARLQQRVGTVNLTAFDATGGPARGETAVLVPVRPHGVLQRDSMVRFPLDGVGRGATMLSPGPWVAAVQTANGFGVVAFDLLPGAVDVEVRLEPLGRMRLALRDDAGDPVAGARVRIAGSVTRESPDAIDSARRLFASHMHRRWADLATDARGELALPFLPLDNLQWHAALTWPGGQTEPFVVEARSTALALRPKPPEAAAPAPNGDRRRRR